MPRRERTANREATLFTRENLPGPASERRNAVAAQLAAVANSGALDAFDVVQWAKRVPVEGPQDREQTLAEEFRAWADDDGVHLAPCFDTRECYAEASGAKRTELVMPVLCLAVYEDGELVEVTPHATDDGVVTVADCLERLENEDGQSRREDAAVSTAD